MLLPVLRGSSGPQSRRCPAAPVRIALVAVTVLVINLVAFRSLWSRNQSSTPGGTVGCRLAPPGRLSAAASSGAAPPLAPGSQQRLAVLIPYRDKEDALVRMLPITRRCLDASGVQYDIFVVEQSEQYHFNRGALLNVGALLLEGSDYSAYVFHDVDTVCGPHDHVRYGYPSGPSPYHLTPAGLHPVYNYSDEFVGGNIIFTRHQFRQVNGFQPYMWGWGKEDNNMVRRLQRERMWPPQRPQVPPQPRLDHYWVHMDHEREPEVRIASKHERNRGGFANLEPLVHDDFTSGLRETRFWLARVAPFHSAVRFTVELYCDRALTPWCERSWGEPALRTAAQQ